MRHECYTCHKKTVKNLIEKFRPDDNTAKDLSETIENLLREKHDLPNPYLAALIHRIAKEKINHSDLFMNEKKHANDLLLKNYKLWKEKVDLSPDPFHLAAKLAVVGNIIDYGAHSAEKDLELQINELLKRKFEIDETDALFNAIQKADSILYLGDNAGEIVFDKLFIETLGHPGITYAVRGQTVINDVTMEDAERTGMDKICKVISNGNDAPSTLPDLCSKEFLDHYYSSDIIISKGQGNFEGLMNSGKDNIFFMLMAKCDPIADLLKVKKGSLLVTKIKSLGNVA